MSNSISVIEEEILYNDDTGRYTLYRPRTGETRQSSHNACVDMSWLGMPAKKFNNRKEVEEYIRSCKVTMLTGSIKELGVPQ